MGRMRKQGMGRKRKEEGGRGGGRRLRRAVRTA
jgi:hypothetical protein